MQSGCIVVLDIGKRVSKLSLWSEDNRLLGRREHRNSRILENGLPVLDIKGITFWLAQTLAVFSRQEKVSAIIPVCHGAAACLIDEQGLVAAPLDYEVEPPNEIKAQYRHLRDSFAITGSPELPACLNAGVQILWRNITGSDRMRQAMIVTWPQYWAWCLSGVAATECTSLGCHTDLWSFHEGRPSPMAIACGWADRFAPLRRADEILGTVTEDWQKRCGLPSDCAVYCGIHDSNSALQATRGYPEIKRQDCTVLSTGTWFVAMRSLGENEQFDISLLPQHRDCLVNVDLHGRPVPSARFMGGRDQESLEAAGGMPAEPFSDKEAFQRIAATLAKDGVFAVPSFSPAVGPFPDSVGYWIQRPADQIGRRAIASLYLALMTDTALDLIGSSHSLVVEGRYEDDPVFTSALIALRPRQAIYLSDPSLSIPFGALRLARPQAVPQHQLAQIRPIQWDLTAYAKKWRALAETSALQSSKNPS